MALFLSFLWFSDDMDTTERQTQRLLLAHKTKKSVVACAPRLSGLFFFESFLTYATRSTRAVCWRENKNKTRKSCSTDTT
jgi:hypothetical protein